MTDDRLSGVSTVKTQRAGHLGRIILDRPSHLNAVDLNMAEGISRVLDAWQNDPGVQVILLQSSSPRAFCAGGDLKALHGLIAQEGTDRAFQAMSGVYAVMRKIAAYPKPTVSFLDGIAMGGGIGLGGHATYRVVTENSVIAMPETGIGLTPDAGGSWILSRAPGFSGLRLAVTGNRMNGIGAIMAGFADRMVPAETLSDIAALLEKRGAHEVFALIAPIPAVNVQGLDGCYDAPDLATAVKNLVERGGEEGQKDLMALSQACPFSVQLAWEAWHRARNLTTLDAAFEQEETLVSHLIRRKDFTEGVRSKLIDRDGAPQWTPGTLPEVDMAEVHACFTR
ncbi:putative enoyl-CoA hydratase [Acetobacter cibinongensis]|uniref:3-hydroxyisobutyryl-CoA hydrolase n=1 Tax=Acetobacter cibinongensis TaxID=146475 RepID=A0A0D6MZI9_9PROT|nr:enoyl-CoA hydratase/isomerase family protein [Acetobacter cibinongensis]GAN59177.1 3-hydroxyisobutyryl-CoA hydrolase/enoyl-CoA hydratase [Acetobacter cibinongensis]GBQ19188.1 3-hydroxyisobutyryl-CoA hydrolase [Acetobacter cibinongensis NRIC 0482]GEL59555.1 putative enoyl-CoA hydratase [Acetobacter cibinongensis]